MKPRSFGPKSIYLLTLIWAVFTVALHAEPADFEPNSDPLPPDGIHVLDGSCVLNVGELRVNITNFGLIGSQYSGGYTYSDSPSGEWPGGSGNEYLWGAGLWIGAQQGGSIGVTTGQTERELRPSNLVRDTIYEAQGGIVLRPHQMDHATGMRMPAPFDDDDFDGAHDEDPLNGVDDDRDGQVDEDFGQLGDQMFTCTMYDNLPLIGEIYPEHQPLGLKVTQTAFTWDRDLYQNAVGLDYEITNVGNHELEEVDLGFYVDCDIQRRDAGANEPNDLAGSYSGIVRAANGYFYRVEMGYMWDGAEEDPLPGYFGALLADHKTAFDGASAPFYPKINSFQIFSTHAAVNQEGEPLDDGDRYYLMSRNHKDRNTRPDESADYKFLMSSGPFDPLEVGGHLNYSLALVMGHGLDDLLTNAVETARMYFGLWYDIDNSWWTGYGGRETLVCLGDYPAPPFGDDPIYGHRVNFMDDSCTGGYPVMFEDIVRDELLTPNTEDQLCIWVNMDNCTECLRATGAECDDKMFFSNRYRFRTGVGGRETNYPWSQYIETPPAAPAARVVPGERKVEIFWDDRSEFDLDPFRHVPDFESYRIWRVEEWVPPGDLADDSLPPVDKWGLVGEFDIVNEIAASVTGSSEPVGLGKNTGLDVALYEPACLRDSRFDGAAEAMQTLVDADPYYLWYTRPPIRKLDGSVAPGMETLVRWETYPDVLDTFFAVTARVEDEAMGVIGKPATRYYHFVDANLNNGFPYYYAVTARDHRLGYIDGEYVPIGVGIEADPSNYSLRAMPRSDGQTVAERKADGNNIYVFPNPATRKALAEFAPRSLSSDDPTGVRVMFNNLPLAHNTIKIFTIAGDLLTTIYHDGTTQGGATSWNLMTRNGQEIVSGVYLYSVHSDEGGFDPFRGRFVVIR